jgi:hypothetical protein
LKPRKAAPFVLVVLVLETIQIRGRGRGRGRGGEQGVNFSIFGGLSLTPFLRVKKSGKRFREILMLLSEPPIHRRVRGGKPTCRFFSA